MKKWMFVILFLTPFLHASDPEKQPLVPKPTHPLTIDQLATYINSKNKLDLRDLGDKIFCTKPCCVDKFIALNQKHAELGLICKLKRKKAQKLQQQLDARSNKRFNVYELPVD